MKRHIIVEGMDGSGKDTLIKHLVKSYSGHTLHERASTSLGGPVSNLSEWTLNDATAMPTQRPSIYNRHPVISEPIYAPRRRVNRGLTGVWTDPLWVAEMQATVAQYSVVVLCQPPWDTIYDNLSVNPDAHMPGVFEAAPALWADYILVGTTWPGPIIKYDYTRDTLAQTVTLIDQTMEPFHG